MVATNTFDVRRASSPLLRRPARPTAAPVQLGQSVGCRGMQDGNLHRVIGYRRSKKSAARANEGPPRVIIHRTDPCRSRFDPTGRERSQRDAQTERPIRAILQHSATAHLSERQWDSKVQLCFRSTNVGRSIAIRLLTDGGGAAEWAFGFVRGDWPERPSSDQSIARQAISCGPESPDSPGNVETTSFARPGRSFDFN